MEEGRVCLPGIGTLLVVQQPALVSLIEGRATAPAARVSFNANLVVDDGRLVRQIGEPELVQQFLQQTRQSLDAGRTVLLEGVGRLFRHPDGEVRFTPGGDNFSKESFGLPNLDIRPIVRQEKPVEEPTPRRRPKPVRQIQDSEFGRRYGNVAWYAAALAGILTVLFLLFRLAGTVSDVFGSNTTTAVPRDRLNVPPRPRTAPATIDANEVQPEPPPRMNEAPEAVEETNTRDESSAPVPPAEEAAPTNVAIIAIGLFGRQRNVDKQTRRLSEAGYTPYTDQEGRNTRVGVRVTYQEEAELNRVLREIRARYTEDAFVMRVNGEDRRPR